MFIKACPDIWRQYHLTTVTGPPDKSPHPDAHRSPAYCYNCARMGHFGHECTDRRMFNGTFPTRPFASSYDTQHDIQRREHRVHLRAKELQEAGLLEQVQVPPTLHLPRKKFKSSHFRSAPIPHLPNTHPPKRRIAHTPKHPAGTTPKSNTHLRWQDDTPFPKKMRKTPDPYSAATPEFTGKKKKKKKKKNQTAVNEEHDFPRSFHRSPCSKGALIHTPPYAGRKSTGMLFGSEKSKKKKHKEDKRARKAARDPEDLFLIKQRKRSR